MKNAKQAYAAQISAAVASTAITIFVLIAAVNSMTASLVI